MSTASLHTLPIELIYRIIDNIDVRTIFLSFRNVCQRFNTIVNTYPSYKLDFRLISKPDFHQVCRIICPENVISIILSDKAETPGQIGLFLSFVDIRQFTSLQSLTLIQVDNTNLDTILKNVPTSSLVSLSIDSTEFDNTTLALLSSATENIDPILTTSASTTEHTSRSVQRFIKQLSVSDCTPEEYFNILRSLVHLEKLELDNHWMHNNVQIAVPPSNLTSYLKSLSIEQDNLSMDVCDALLSVIPLLTYLKIKVSIHSDRSLCNGSKWEQIIQTKLPHLKAFEFFIETRSNENLSVDDLNSIIDPFRTVFWIELKQWFVTCEYETDLHALKLYSIPIIQSPFRHIPDSEKNPNSILVTTNVAKQSMRDHITSLQVFLPPPPSKVRYTSKQMDLLIDRLYPNVTELHLRIDKNGSRHAMEYLSTLIYFSHLVKLFLCLDTTEFPVREAIHITSDILQRSQNLCYLDLPYSMSYYICDSMIYAMRSLVPKQMKYLTIEAGDAEEMKKIVKWSTHVFSIVFTSDGDLISDIDDIDEWLTETGRDYTYIRKNSGLYLWFTPESAETLKAENDRKRIKLTTDDSTLKPS